MSMTREEASRHLHNDWYIENGHLCVYENARDLFLEAVGMGIKALRPVSREQVILCKDCRYWQGNNGWYPHPECIWGNDEMPDEDDYCSFAERLEVSKNG